MFYFRQPQQGGGWLIAMLENRLKPSEEGRGRRWRLRRSPTATSYSTTSPPSVAAVVKAHTTHLWNAYFNCFSRGAEFLEFTHRLNESCHVYVYELMLRWQNVKLGRHHRQRREGGGVGFFQSVSQIASHTHRMCVSYFLGFSLELSSKEILSSASFQKYMGQKINSQKLTWEITCFFWIDSSLRFM